MSQNTPPLENVADIVASIRRSNFAWALISGASLLVAIVTAFWVLTRIGHSPMDLIVISLVVSPLLALARGSGSISP
jgi:hypothetical protein